MTADTLTADTLTASTLTAGTLTADTLTAGTLTAGTLTAGTLIALQRKMHARVHPPSLPPCPCHPWLLVLVLVQDDANVGKGVPGISVHEVRDDTIAKDAGVEVRQTFFLCCEKRKCSVRRRAALRAIVCVAVAFLLRCVTRMPATCLLYMVHFLAPQSMTLLSRRH